VQVTLAIAIRVCVCWITMPLGIALRSCA